MTPTYLGAVGGEILTSVVERLPAEVRRFVMSNVCFIVVGESHGHGQTWNKRWIRPAHGSAGDDVAEWVIALSEGGMIERVVAHEIAHAWRGHAEGAESEAEAERLASEWGF